MLLSAVEKKPYNIGESSVSPAVVFLGNMEAIQIERYPQFYTSSWGAEIFPEQAFTLLRGFYRRMQVNYIPPELSDQNRREQVFLFSGKEARELSICDFLQRDRFSQYLSPEVESVRVNTPFGYFLVSMRPRNHERQNKVLSQLNLSRIIAEFAVGTSEFLGDPIIKDPLTGLLDILLRQYPVPEQVKKS